MTYDQWKLATPPEHEEAPDCDGDCFECTRPADCPHDDGDRADEAHERDGDR